MEATLTSTPSSSSHLGPAVFAAGPWATSAKVNAGLVLGMISGIGNAPAEQAEAGLTVIAGGTAAVAPMICVPWLNSEGTPVMVTQSPTAGSVVAAVWFCLTNTWMPA